MALLVSVKTKFSRSNSRLDTCLTDFDFSIVGFTILVDSLHLTAKSRLVCFYFFWEYVGSCLGLI